jgi:hypothetical protein
LQQNRHFADFEAFARECLLSRHSGSAARKLIVWAIGLARSAEISGSSGFGAAVIKFSAGGARAAEDVPGGGFREIAL